MKATQQRATVSRRVWACLFACVALGNPAHAQVSIVTEREALAWEAQTYGEAAAQEREWFVQPRRAQHALVDRAAMEALLARAPMLESPSVQADNPQSPSTTPVRVPLPLPDGSVRWFVSTRTPVMEPALQAKFPQLQAFAGVCEDEPTLTAWFELTNHGLRATIRGHDEGFAFIDPARAGSREHVLAYWLRDASVKAWDWHCAAGHDAIATPDDNEPRDDFTTRGTHVLKQFRLAIACTGEYGAYQSSVLGNPPNVTDAMSAIVTIVNRTNATFEPDMGVRFVLVASNDLIAFFNPATDPYPSVACDTPSSDCSTPYYGVNQGVVDALIGSENYDVGHVMTRLPGGVANLRSVCVASRKALGVSGIPRGGENEPVSALVVIHELGHQFGANHSYNGLLGRCGPNWAGITAREPGGGSTQMSYPGACPVGGGIAGDNLVTFCDPYFHTGPLTEMRAFVLDNALCATTIDTSNALPVITSAGPTLRTIPPQTPFSLTGTISDSNSGHTFTWDQMDNGPQQTIEGPDSLDNGASPLFRSLPPIASATRVFPNWQSVLAGTDNRGERFARVPGSQRKFRLTVRDNAPGAAGSVSSNLVRVNIADSPRFVVTRPAAGETVRRGSATAGTITIAWTPSSFPASVATTQLDLLLTTDEGLTWIPLASGVPLSTGTISVPVPAGVAPGALTARVQARSVGNIFFQVSQAFAILPPCGSIDFNQDGLFPDDSDLVDFLSILAGGACGTPSCDTIDFNRDGLFPDEADIVDFLRVLAGGNC
jgi:hypothetical protein